MMIAMARKVAPSGFPTCRKREAAIGSVSEDDDDEEEEPLPSAAKEVLRRKSCVTATPMEAKDRDVRSQARKVRSGLHAEYQYWDSRTPSNSIRYLTKCEMIPRHAPLILQFYTPIFVD